MHKTSGKENASSSVRQSLDSFDKERVRGKREAGREDSSREGAKEDDEDGSNSKPKVVSFNRCKIAAI
jgi:hypothetical protein